MPSAVWPIAMKHEAYELACQGFTEREIVAELIAKHSAAEAPSQMTVNRWLRDPDAQPVIASIKQRIQATVAHRTHAVLGRVYDAVEKALETGDLRQVDSGVRAVVGLTRGFVADRVELEPPKAVGGDAELRALLAAHGVNLNGSDNQDGNAQARNIS